MKKQKQSVRMIPNVLIRSALFSTKRLSNKRNVVSTKIYSQNGYEVTYDGEELNQIDSQVYQAVVMIMKSKSDINTPNTVKFNIKDIILLLGKHGNGNDYTCVKNSLNRLKKCVITIASGKTNYSGNLLNYVYSVNNDNQVEVNSVFCNFLTSSDQTVCDVESKSKISKLLSKWLFDYFRSHSRYIPLDIEYLLNLCGSNMNIRKFRQQLKISMDELILNHSFPIKSYSIENDKLSVSSKNFNKTNIIEFEEFNPFEFINKKEKV